MISRGSVATAAVTCGGFSAFTRSGPFVGREEGRLIASSARLNLRSRRFGRGEMLAAGAVRLRRIAIGVRTRPLPRAAGGGGANAGERLSAAEGAIRALARALEDTRTRLESRADNALQAPAEPVAAFAFLSHRSPLRDDESFVVYAGNRPLAWTGAMRVDPDSITAPVSVTFSEFYTTLNVVRSRGNRRAVASAVLEAFAPADRLTETLENQLAAEQGVTGYDFSLPADARGGPVVLAVNNTPIVRAVPRLATAEEMRFRRAATFRARGTVALVILLVAFLFFAWRSRRQLGLRLFAIGIALLVTALVPWNSFSNTARLFDPAFYFSKLAGPLTAHTAVLSLSSAPVLLSVFPVFLVRP